MSVPRLPHAAVLESQVDSVNSVVPRWLRLVLVLALALMSLPFASPAIAAGITVTTTADTIDAAGTCPAVTLASLPGPDGQTSLREALCAAQTNAGADTITFSVNGTFAITLTPGTGEDAGATGDFDIRSDVTITGNGSGNTIIDGQDLDRVFDIDPLSNCNASTSCTIALSEMTIRNGRAFAANFNVGGAIFIGSRATVTITNSVIESSASAAQSGGGIQAVGAGLTLTNVIVQNNSAFSNGGGINAASTLTINNSTFLNNQAEFGGALSLLQNSTKTVSISNSTFSGNRTVTTAGVNPDDGGAIHASTDTTITITGSTFSANTSANDGGGLFLQDAATPGTGTFNLTNDTISGNRADTNGGGINIVSGNATITNVTITQNHSDNNNAGGEVGGGLRVAGGTVTLNNTIVAENYRGSGTGTTDNVNGAIGGSNNLTSGAPLLGPLANNGGSTQTHALLTGSPAIDTGNNAVCPATDQRGTSRPLDGDGTPGAVCDIGAYEILPDTTPPDTSITSTPPNPSNDTTPTFGFTGSDNLTPAGSLTFQCQIDGGGFSPCTSPATFGPLPAGSHTFQVRAIDTANNVDPTPASFTWIIDTTAPDTTITANPTNPSASANASFSFSGTDNLTPPASLTFQCQLDGGSFSACTSPQTYTGLSDGSHTFQVRAVDAASNPDTTPASFTWVIDTTPPPAPVVVTPANGSSTNNTQPVVSGTAEANSTVTVFLDGVAAGTTTADGAGNWTFTPPTPLSDGSHTVRARATDAVGNTSVDSNTNTFTVDTVAPDTTITANPTNPSASANASFSFTGSDPGGSGVAGFECQLDGGAFIACTSPQTYTSLADGSHTFVVRAVDAAGNADSTPASFTWVVDATGPDTTITANPTNPSASTSASFSFTGNDGSGTGVASFQCQLDGGGFSTCTSPQNYTSLSQGSHTFQVRAIDAVGNADSTPASFTWVIDTVAPDTTITANPTNPSASANASFSFTGSDPGGSGVAGFECQIDGGAFIACTSPQTYTGLADGSHTFQVRAVDAAGNLDGTPASFTWVIDTTGPDTTLTATPPNPSASANASFSFTGNDGGGTGVVGFECQIDGGAFIACASPRTYTGLSDGSHTFVVRAVDAAGNADSTPASFTWVIDTTPPPAPVVITPANGSSTNNTQPLVSGTAEANSTVTVFIDGTAAGTTTADSSGNWTFTPPTPLSDGSHTVRARATDAVGNTSVDSNTNTFIVDTVAPDTTITANPANPSASANASFSFTGNDGGGSGVVGFECQIDGGGFSTCTSPQTYTGLADGSHTFQVRAVDAAGNVDSTPASFTWIIDTTEPDTTITANPTNPSASANASFSFTGTDGSGTGVVGFECQLDGGGFSTCTSPQTYTGLADGSHTFQVRAVDIANNRDSTPASFTWVVDTTAPDTTITANPTNPSASANASFSFTGNDGGGSGVASFECQLDGAGFTACTSPQTYTGLADGSHTFLVRAIDAAGNVDGTPAIFTWVVDTTAPTVAFSSAAPDPTNVSPIPVTVTFSENVTGFTAGDITASNGTVNNFAGSGSVYTFDLVPSGQGLVTADIAAGVAQDSASNGNTAVTQFSRTYDSIAPTVTINQAAGQADPTGVAPINFTVVFNEPVTGFGDSAADVTIAGTAGATTATVTGSGTTYNVAITGMTGTGTVIVTIPAGAAQDLATNPNAASTSTDNTVDFDPVVPVVTGIVRADPSPTSAQSVQYTVTFSKNVAGVDASDFTFTTSGVTGASVTGVTGSGTTWTVTVDTGTGDGTLRLDLVDDDSIMDIAANPLGGKGAGNGDFTAGQVYTIDKTAPSVISVTRAGANPTNAATVDFTVTFSEVVIAVDPTDFSLTSTGVTGAGITGVTGGGATWTVTVNTGSGDGSIRLDVVDDDTILDVIGNQLGGTGLGNGNFNTGEVYTIDKTAPTAGSLVTPPVVRGGTTYTFTLVLTDNLAIDIGSLDASDVRVTGPGGFSQLATLVGANPATDGTPRTVTYQITPPGGSWNVVDSGAYTVTLEANQVFDTAGNPVGAVTLGSFQVNLVYRLFLPFIANPAQPDLVAKISLAPNQSSFTASTPVVVMVTVTNQGEAPAQGFWVDLLINPSTIPTTANVVWNKTCTLTPCYGMAWYVPGPLAPGASITLSSTSAPPDYSIWPGHFAAGTTDLYAYVDSWNPGIATGSVYESNEANNSDHIGGLTVTGPNPPSLSAETGSLKERPVHLRK